MRTVVVEDQIRDSVRSKPSAMSRLRRHRALGEDHFQPTRKRLQVHSQRQHYSFDHLPPGRSGGYDHRYRSRYPKGGHLQGHREIPPSRMHLEISRRNGCVRPSSLTFMLALSECAERQRLLVLQGLVSPFVPNSSSFMVVDST